MEIWYKIIGLFLSVVAGGVLVELFKKASHLKLLLSFSGGFLLTIIFTHIFPESYKDNGSITGYFILLGFLLQLILEYFSKGAEHGHTHIHHEDGDHVHKTFPIAIFVSLSLHAFIESVPLDHHGHAHVDDLYWGVILHKIPVAVALMTILVAGGYSRKQSWIYLILFGLTAPLGILMGEPILENLSINPDYILSVAVGMFLHISTTIIFESSEGHKLNFIKLIAILAGFAMGMVMT
ncbi:ZIP family metal transporter [Paracrocinitomix mangrovi]|uniref:ZIP family metal transporter n=1 Tax=Paracrocinitomix mangrovi TaxID=2862509 RepID=UPI001EDC6634|nr:ZIP family metal transporter [Paracrocinitomix mangrovi]UKN02973.1 ZIP family metal transporter [Paracrocinitomix mangrovi]